MVGQLHLTLMERAYWNLGWEEDGLAPHPIKGKTKNKKGPFLVVNTGKSRNGAHRLRRREEVSKWDGWPATRAPENDTPQPWLCHQGEPESTNALTGTGPPGA